MPQNSRFTAFTLSELLWLKQQEGGLIYPARRLGLNKTKHVKEYTSKELGVVNVRI